MSMAIKTFMSVTGEYVCNIFSDERGYMKNLVITSPVSGVLNIPPDIIPVLVQIADEQEKLINNSARWNNETHTELADEILSDVYLKLLRGELDEDEYSDLLNTYTEIVGCSVDEARQSLAYMDANGFSTWMIDFWLPYVGGQQNFVDNFDSTWTVGSGIADRPANTKDYLNSSSMALRVEEHEPGSIKSISFIPHEDITLLDIGQFPSLNATEFSLIVAFLRDNKVLCDSLFRGKRAVEDVVQRVHDELVINLPHNLLNTMGDPQWDTKIKDIKKYREITGASLRDAKCHVEYMATNGFDNWKTVVLPKLKTFVFSSMNTLTL